VAQIQRGRVELLDTNAAVETPERVRFYYRLAGPGPRAAAWLIDGVIRAVILLALVFFVTLFALVPGGLGWSSGLLAVAVFLLDWFYGAIFETLLSGRTPGKMALSLRVVKEDGAPGRFQDFLLRNVLRGVDFLPLFFGIGVLTMLMDRKLRRIGDMVAGTVVVIEQRERVLGQVHIQPPVTEEERQSMPPMVDLSREELGILEEFLRRRRKLSDERAEELAELFGPVLSERTGLKAPTWERVLVLAYARATGKDR
jgi:uncharacterized RDD family membrane protein YckC